MCCGPHLRAQMRVIDFPSIRIDKFSFAWKEVRGNWRKEGGPKSADFWKTHQVGI